MTGVPSVLVTPGQYDVFVLDIGQSPGISVLTDGARKIDINDQGQLLTLGKNTVVRARENVVATYDFKLWEPEHFATRDAWIDIFESGSKTQPPRIYTIRDLRMPWVSKVIYQGMKPQGVDKPGGPWNWQLTLHEYVRVKPFGGPIVESLRAQDLRARRETIADLDNRLAGPVAASKRTKK